MPGWLPFLKNWSFLNKGQVKLERGFLGAWLPSFLKFFFGTLMPGWLYQGRDYRARYGFIVPAEATVFGKLAFAGGPGT